MLPIVIRPDRFRQFGPAEDSAFCLVTNSELIDKFRIEENGSYSDYKIVPYDSGDSFDALLDKLIPEPAHILVISPRRFVESPTTEKLGPRRKLIAMPCNSTPTTLDALEHFIGVVERTDPDRLSAFADRFFELGQASERLEVIDEEYQTRAVFDHLDESYEWNQQAGPIEWGEQQIAPSGELSVLPVDIMQFSPDLRLAINGELALKGQPAVHSGAPSFLPVDQQRTYDNLATIKDHAVIATVENGVIRRLRATHKDAEPAVSMLDAMFEVDSRYRIIWEFGFGINTELELLPGNFGMNEPYGGTNGVAHWGLGLTPYTQYALIIICPGTRILGRGGEVLIGLPESAATRKKGGMNRKKSAACQCHY